MKQVSVERLTHNGREYEVRATMDNTGHLVRVFANGRPFGSGTRSRSTQRRTSSSTSRTSAA